MGSNNTATLPYVTQLPGELNIDMTDDNDLVFAVNWGMDLTDYSFEANIVPQSCEGEIPMTVTVVDAALGKMNIAITAASILDLSPSVNRWYLNWTTPAPDGYIRTVLAGALVLRKR